MAKETESKAPKTKKVKQPKFKIISKRGIRIAEDFFCSLCGVRYSQGWRYRETSRGEVCICYACKEKHARGRLSFKRVSVSAFETSKTRH